MQDSSVIHIILQACSENSMQEMKSANQWRFSNILKDS